MNVMIVFMKCQKNKERTDKMSQNFERKILREKGKDNMK